MAAGEDFLLRHSLFRSTRTGRVARTEFTRLSFPHWWHYDILRALEYFAALPQTPDPRLADALAVLIDKRRPDGRWVRQQRHRGAEWCSLEPVGAPSRWNTLRALRVLAALNPDPASATRP